MVTLIAIGVIFGFAYHLRRHLWLGWSLARWLGLLLLGVAVWSLFHWWPNLWPAATLVLLLVVYVGFLIVAERSGYLRFEPLPDELQRLLHREPPPALLKEELVPVRVSGWFTVEGQDQYYIDVEADFETVGTREHIVLGRIYASRFLLLGRWPDYELGWWYIFFRPAMIRNLALGHLYVDPQPSLALRVVYAPDPETEQTLYLVAQDEVALRRIWDDLVLDIPPTIPPMPRPASDLYQKSDPCPAGPARDRARVVRFERGQE